MVTLKQTFAAFLKEQHADLPLDRWRTCEDAIGLFERYLDGYGFRYLNDKQRQLYDNLGGEEGQSYCDLFGPEHLSLLHISEFLECFLLNKVGGNKERVKKVRWAMLEWACWMKEKGYLPEEDYEDVAQVVAELGDQLPQVEEVVELIANHIQHHPVEDFTDVADGDFRILRIETGRLWLQDLLAGGDEIGPVIVSRQISARCRVGWIINVELGKTSRGWEMRGGGSVRPEP